MQRKELVRFLEYEVEDRETGVKVTNAKQPIVLENVHFEYNEEEQVLKNIDFTIESGKVTAIVGPSGSGKTTLFSLLERFMSQLVVPLN